MKKYATVIICIIFSQTLLLAQKADSALQSKTPLIGKWRVAGINIYRGVNNSISSGTWLPLFYQLGTTDEARNKYMYDVQTTHSHNQISIKEQYNKLSTMGLFITLKPAVKPQNAWVNYTEINAGIRLAYHTTLNTLWGYSEPTSNTANYNYTQYWYESSSTSPSLSYTIQTPGIGGALAFYTGVGIFAGINFSNSVYSTASQKTSVDYNASPRKNTTINVFPLLDNYSIPNYSYGIYFPIGLKINISPRSNIFFETIFTHNTLHFKNNTVKKEWFRGINFGYRVKISHSPKTKQAAEPAKGSPQSPEPFY